MALPKLPGYSFNPNLGKDAFHRSHKFQYNNDVPIEVNEKKPNFSMIPRGDGSAQPSWVAFDKQVLSFDGFFQEQVVEKREETFRVRPVKVYFYLEDDSIQVIEPRLKNSELPQGTLIRRHRIPKPAPQEDQHFMVEDLNVGNEVMFYGRKIKLTKCDEFTYNFLRKLGVYVGAPEGVPTDPYMQYRKALDESMSPLRPYEKQDKLGQFLKHDKHVLRFNAIWDDRESMFGDLHELEIHYFLSDDTMEVKQVLKPNCGKDGVAMLINRRKIPKDFQQMPKPGQIADRTVLNVFGGIVGRNSRHILDSLKTGAVETDTYTERDLAIGAILNVFGRKVMLCDCDEFTREFYRTKYGICEFEAIDYRQELEAAACAARGKKEWPPYNGFGSEEDSLSSCKSFVLKPTASKDFKKFMAKDRTGFDTMTLRFLSRFHKCGDEIARQRLFIISFFLADDTIAVFEPPIRNTGVKGGQFLRREAVKRPGNRMYSTTLPEYYNGTDFFVGNVLNIHEYAFELIDADEYAFNYQEANFEEYHKSNMYSIMSKLCPCLQHNKEKVMQYFEETNPSNADLIPFQHLYDFLSELSGGQMSDHEIITLARCYSPTEFSPPKTKHELVFELQEALRRHNYDVHTNKLYERFIQEDIGKTGFLPSSVVITCVKSFKMPFNMESFIKLLDLSTRNEQGCIDYRELISCLDWKTCPVPPVASEKDRIQETWPFETPRFKQLQINYKSLLGDCLGQQGGLPMQQGTQ